MDNYQETKYVNCPNCGKIIEVISPRVNKNVSKVIAYTSDHVAHENTQTVCSNCQYKCYISWYY
ncbi:MAG: hypothetical protein KAR87_00965 [Candidatus Aenigmarchaeota archaeon]|nr:hypothetical protein [Candidatus Aenigmarchaeota archaeon]